MTVVLVQFNICINIFLLFLLVELQKADGIFKWRGRCANHSDYLMRKKTIEEEEESRRPIFSIGILRLK